MTQTKSCQCGHEGTLADFERFDKLCRSCRKEKGPRQYPRATNTGSHPTVYHQPLRIEPAPSGRSATPRHYPERQRVAV